MRKNKIYIYIYKKLKEKDRERKMDWEEKENSKGWQETGTDRKREECERKDKRKVWSDKGKGREVKRKGRRWLTETKETTKGRPKLTVYLGPTTSSSFFVFLEYYILLIKCLIVFFLFLLKFYEFGLFLITKKIFKVLYYYDLLHLFFSRKLRFFFCFIYGVFG